MHAASTSSTVANERYRPGNWMATRMRPTTGMRPTACHGKVFVLIQQASAAKPYGPQPHADILAVHAFRLRIALPQGQPAPQQYKATRQTVPAPGCCGFSANRTARQYAGRSFSRSGRRFRGCRCTTSCHCNRRSASGSGTAPGTTAFSSTVSASGLQPGKQHRLCKRAAQIAAGRTPPLPARPFPARAGALAAACQSPATSSAQALRARRLVSGVLPYSSYSAAGISGKNAMAVYSPTALSQ